MTKLTLIAIVTALTLAPQAGNAKSVSTTISMNTFKSRCLAAGGQLSDAGAGGVKCKLPSGASVTCYDTDGPGLSCDYRTAGGGRVKGLIAGSGGLGSLNPDSRSHGAEAGQGNAGGSVNPGNAGGNHAPGATTPGGGSMDPGAGGGIEG